MIRRAVCSEPLLVRKNVEVYECSVEPFSEWHSCFYVSFRMRKPTPTLARTTPDWHMLRLADAPVALEPHRVDAMAVDVLVKRLDSSSTTLLTNSGGPYLQTPGISPEIADSARAVYDCDGVTLVLLQGRDYDITHVAAVELRGFDDCYSSFEGRYFLDKVGAGCR